jgi:hypothetical protein
MRPVFLFVLGCVLPGLGGAAGSIVGHRFGTSGLWVGGICGGLLASIAVAGVAEQARWIAPDQRRGTAFGAAIGFLLAATIAVKTLSSPVGPILSTLIAGIGTVLGSRTFSSRPAA